jgi:uncharacterized protein (TIGR00730 family)
MSAQIAVFGGSLPKPGEPAYEDASHLGKQLALAGYTVLTGGYIGCMEAVSRGASEAGGHVIGVTCDQIEAWRPVRANAWVNEEWHCATFIERIARLIEHSDVYLALPGGIGTLVEITLAWNLLLTRILPPRPLIVIGAGWQAVIQQFLAEQGKYIPQDQRVWVIYATDVNDAFLQLRERLAEKNHK